MRTTYLALGDAGPNVHFADNTLCMNGLQAAKHVVVREDAELACAASIEWANTALDLPFDPPAPGVRVHADLDCDVSAVVNWAKNNGIELLENPVVADDWLEWYPVSAPSSDFDAMRISLDPRTNEMVTETWNTAREWMEVPTEGEVGVFALGKIDPSVFELKGTVFRFPSAGTAENVTSSAVLMHWYAKHATPHGSVFASFDTPYGLHPKLNLQVETTHPDDLEMCRLYAALELPSNIFVDQYELDDLEKADEPASLIAAWGNTDLEKPQWAEPQGSLTLLALNGRSGNYTVPLHFRYVAPSANHEHTGVLPAPRVFWVCRNDIAPTRLPEYIEPRELLGIEAVFPVEDSVFFPVVSEGVSYRIPAIDPQYENEVGLITSVVVVIHVLLFLYMMGRSLHKKKQD